MADSPYEVVEMEEDNEDPVPASELQELNEEKRILSSVYRHVEHQQVVEQVAGVAGVIADDVALSANESKSPSSPWMGSATHKTSSLPLSAGGSEGSESILGLPVRLSAGVGSTEASDIGREDSVKELSGLPNSLDSALRLNMALQRRFRSRIVALENIYTKNIERQAVLKEEITSARTVKECEPKSDNSGKLSVRISHFCVPYFKNRSGMPAPMNDDAKMKVESGYIDLYTTRPRTWMTVERERLDIIVRDEWKIHRLTTTEMTVRELERKLRKLCPDDEEVVKSLQEDINKLKKEIEELEKTPTMEIVPSRGEKQLDWDVIAAKAFDGHRTPDEARLQWENYLHPDVNVNQFTEMEDLFIQKIIMSSRVKQPDWERIARDMKTSRTAYQVMQRYVSFIEPTLHPRRWDKTDSDKLLNIVNMLRVGNHIPWAQVHQHFVGYSRSQIQGRWRMIDPEITKGSFTVEEDNILIKGLHMFGLNFDMIKHFMPGRHLVQVRSRYKRTIWPSISLKPWSKEEDDILIKECKVGPKNWRKMVMELPRFNACQIRVRYHIIQVWQTLSGTNLIPPPLFPITCTVNPDTVQEIRSALITEDPDLKRLVDESRKRFQLKSVVKELEERRLLIRERKSENNMTKLKRVTEKRGKNLGAHGPYYKPLQDILLTDFFIPSRNYSQARFPKLSFDAVKTSLRTLGTALQLKIVGQVTDDDIASGLLDCEDVAVIKEMTKSHVLSGDLGCASSCPACLPIHPDKTPLLPPCSTTVGAFRSLLVHRPKLKEMASKEFFLYKYNRSELHTLETHYRGRVYFKRGSNKPQEKGPSQPGRTSETEVSQDESDGAVLAETHNNTAGRGGKGKNKIHITYQARSKEAPKSNMKSITKALSEGVKAYSRGKAVKGEVVDSGTSNATGIPGIGGIPIVKLEVNGQEITNWEDRPLPAEEEVARKASDNLLFQRMLSIFCWPALLTLSKPPHLLVDRMNEKIESGELEKPSQPLKPKTVIGKDDLDVEAQERYISVLTNADIKDREEREKRKEHNAEIKEREKKKGQLKSESKDSSTDAREEQDDSNAEDVTEGENSSSDCRQFNRGYLREHHRKNKLKSLRRSLVMKKIWDARRKGNYPQRTSDREKRNYKPRGSRTRDCVRLDMLKTPKGPQIWNFPLDGPMRVQPQVPAVPSEEILINALSKATSANTLSENLEVDPLDVPPIAKPENTQDLKSKLVRMRSKKSDLEKPSEEVLLEIEEASGVKSPVSSSSISQRKRKSNQSHVKIMSTTADIHAAMNDNPWENLLDKSTISSNINPQLLEGSTFPENKGNSADTQEISASELLKVEVISEANISLDHSNKTSEIITGTRPIRKRAFDASSCHLDNSIGEKEDTKSQLSASLDQEVIRSKKGKMQVSRKKSETSSNGD